MVLKNLQLQLRELEEQQDTLSFQMIEAEGDEYEELAAALDEVEIELEQVRSAIEDQELTSGN